MPTGHIGICTPNQRVNVRIRTQPNETCSTVALLAYGTTVDVCVVGNEWVRVDYKGAERFVSRAWVSVMYG